MSITYMGRSPQDIAAALELWDKNVTPRHELLAELRKLRDGPTDDRVTVVNGIMVGIAQLVMDEENARRKYENLRMSMKKLTNKVMEQLE